MTTRREPSAATWGDRARLPAAFATLALASTALLSTALVSTPAPAADASPATRLAELEDREAIRLVLRDYGRLLDLRRFEEFGRLFAPDGEYTSAGRTTRGPAQIAEGLRSVMAGNSLGLAEPNFHVLFNDHIVLHGDTATATSQSFFVAPGPDGAPRLVMMASYDDQLVRTAQGWRFARRVVRGDMVPRPPQPPAR